MFDVVIREVDPFRVAGIRHVGPYEGVGAAFEKIMSWAGRSGRLGSDTKSVGLYHDDPRVTPAAELRSDACVSVGADFTGDPDAGVTVIEVEGGSYAVGTLKGPYSQLPAAYGWLIGEWIPSSGREAAERTCFEVYLNSPADTAPEELLTVIYHPLK